MLRKDLIENHVFVEEQYSLIDLFEIGNFEEFLKLLRNGCIDNRK